MDSKKLVKVIKTIVEAEVAKKHEKFLTEQFPKILDEAVKGKMKSSNKTQVVSEEVDPFEKANQVLQNEREEQPKQQFSKNAAINEVLTIQNHLQKNKEKEYQLLNQYWIIFNNL